jgi:pimeloyl-ACP methyl ester carboxylesterase
MELITSPVPPAEPCIETRLDPAFVDPPAALVSGSEGRLIDDLRIQARGAAADPVLLLGLAAVRFLEADGLLPTTIPSPALRGNAYADLTVTSRRAYRNLLGAVADRSDLAPLSETLRAIVDSRVGARPISAAQREAAIHRAVQRASQVVWALYGPAQGRAELRATLGWCAVSGEDSVPGRPVNVPSGACFQGDVQVRVGDIVYTTRYGVAQFSGDERMPSAPTGLPPDRLPSISDDDRIVLVLHGHSSRLEEGMSLVGPLQRLDAQRTIVMVDLPCNGYSDRIEHTLIAPAAESHYDPENPDRCRFPVLDFIEESVLAFVDALDTALIEGGRQGIAHRIEAVIGGSLGGNLGLRLARRLDPRAPRVVAWSPASVWESFGRATSNPFDALRPGRYVDVFKDIAFNRTKDRMDDAEAPDSRQFHIARQFDGEELINGWDWTRWVGSQSTHWYRPDWGACGRLAVEGGRRFIREAYGTEWRRWHWRVAHEQLGFSHRDQVGRDQPRSFEQMVTPLLLVAAELDNDDQVRIYSETCRLARDIPTNSGHGLAVPRTGHSVHSERPRFLAQHIHDFLPRAIRPPQAAPLHLYWNADRGDNMTTASREGRNDAQQAGYRYVRVEGYGVATGRPDPALANLDLYWSWDRLDNFVTASDGGRRDAEDAGYVLVRTEARVFRSQIPGTVPLELFWSEGRGDNMTVASEQARRDATEAGYRRAQVEGFVYPARVAFRTRDGHVLCAELGGGREVNASRTVPLEWETFEVWYVGPNVMLRSHLGFFVSAQGSGSLVASARNGGELERFRIEDAGLGRVALRAHDGRFVSAEGGGGGAVLVTARTIGENESFELIGM